MTTQTEIAELGAMTVKEFCNKYRIGTTKFYEEIKAGRLRQSNVEPERWSSIAMVGPGSILFWQ
jgi:hypothetical protein